MTADDASQQNRLQTVRIYGAIIISVLVIAGFILELYLAYMHDDQHTKDTISNLINNAVMIILGYWVGSAVSSQMKDTLLLNSKPLHAEQDVIPPPPKAV